MWTSLIIKLPLAAMRYSWRMRVISLRSFDDLLFHACIMLSVLNTIFCIVTLGTMWLPLLLWHTVAVKIKLTLFYCATNVPRCDSFCSGSVFTLFCPRSACLTKTVRYEYWAFFFYTFKSTAVQCRRSSRRDGFRHIQTAEDTRTLLSWVQSANHSQATPTREPSS